MHPYILLIAAKAAICSGRPLLTVPSVCTLPYSIGKATHFGTNNACFSLTGPLQISANAIKARCLSKDLSGENKGTPEQEKKPLKEEKCPPLALAGIDAAGKVILVQPGTPSAGGVPVDKIIACWNAIPEDLLPIPILPTTPKYAILSFKGVLREE
ncbi:MAG: hypothetical protein J3Q66DRAFT_76977 [Benniella sp.]|nr:MAG: hypothetical protein J3Q66DRAFT_76977 [Benniella sp.]